MTADIHGIYAKRTKADPEQIKQWMYDETWMRAPDALARGFVDSIDESDKITNVAFPMLANYKNTPKHLLVEATKPNVLLAKMNARISKTRPAGEVVTQSGQPTAKTTAA